MKIIKLKESQYNKLFESVSNLKGASLSTLNELPGSSESMSMITIPITDMNGDISNGKPMNSGSDKVAKTITIQTPWNAKKSSYHN